MPVIISSKIVAEINKYKFILASYDAAKSSTIIDINGDLNQVNKKTLVNGTMERWKCADQSAKIRDEY